MEQVSALLGYGRPELRIKCLPVIMGERAVEAIETVIARMKKELTDYHHGVGISANQIGLDRRIALVKSREQEAVLINPEIVEANGPYEVSEGCLSLRGLFCKIKRFQSVKVRNFDALGNESFIEASGVFAQVLQHEIDHLNGVLFIDHLDKLGKVLNEGKIKRMARQYKGGALCLK